MSKRIRQYFGILSAIVSYYLIHEGAHLLYALFTNTFKQINFMGLGTQIDVYVDRMSTDQLGIFCVVGSIATLLAAYVLVLLTNKICRSSSKVFKACMYYITTAMLFIDPLYLSVLFAMFGGGDMNGITLLIDERIARTIYGALFLMNILIFFKHILPVYKQAFKEK